MKRLALDLALVAAFSVIGIIVVFVISTMIAGASGLTVEELCGDVEDPFNREQCIEHFNEAHGITPTPPPASSTIKRTATEATATATSTDRQTAIDEATAKAKALLHEGATEIAVSVDVQTRAGRTWQGERYGLGRAAADSRAEAVELARRAAVVDSRCGDLGSLITLEITSTAVSMSGSEHVATATAHRVCRFEVPTRYTAIVTATGRY